MFELKNEKWLKETRHLTLRKFMSDRKIKNQILSLLKEAWDKNIDVYITTKINPLFFDSVINVKISLSSDPGSFLDTKFFEPFHIKCDNDKDIKNYAHRWGVESIPCDTNIKKSHCIVERYFIKKQAKMRKEMMKNDKNN